MGRYYDDELYHWKYKRKYRGPNGDWVYVYNDGSMSDRGKTETSQSETDAWGNIKETKHQVVTNPNRWLSRKTVEEHTTTNTTVKDGQAQTTTKHTTTETVERGKLHIFKMNLERKISELPGKTVKRAKDNWNYQQSMKKNRRKGESGYDYYKRYKKEHQNVQHSDDDLYHWGMKRGAKAKDHKYYQRIPWKKGYRYFYTKDEYQAYLTGKDPQQKQSTGLLGKINDIGKSIGKSVEGVSQKAEQAIDLHNKTIGRYDELKEGNHPKEFDDLPRKNDKNSEGDDQMAVNPHYKGEYDPAKQVVATGLKLLDDSVVTKKVAEELTSRYGYRNNCAYCTLTYDMRRKGYDVEASSVTTKTCNTPEEIESWYKGGKFKTSGPEYALMDSKRASEQITKELASEGVGARGQFCIYWTKGGGHSISYEVDEFGVTYRDCQTGDTMVNEDINDYLKNAQLDNIKHMRTDNLEFTDKALHGVKPRKRKKK